MPKFDSAIVATMRAALDDVMTHVPIDQANSIMKVRLAEFILKAAKEGQTSYDALFAAAYSQIQTALLSVA